MRRSRRGMGPSTMETDSLLQEPMPISIEELSEVEFEVEFPISIPPISIPE